MKKLLFIYKWSVFIPVVGVLTLALGTACLILCLLVPPAVAGRWCGRTWARLIAHAAFMSVAVEGAQFIDHRRSYIVAANHQSQLDILVVYGWLDLDFRWVMKKELRKVPILGICCEKLGHIFIDRLDISAAVAAINRAKEKITEGTSIFFFPEGTRSRDGNLLPFKKGAFRMALDLQLPILPVSIVGTHDILPAGTMCLQPGRSKMIVHPPIETSGWCTDKISELMKRTREAISQVL
jgi:1-acyl-sn-glycerol-3-phosphate acyltransferase